MRETWKLKRSEAARFFSSVPTILQSYQTPCGFCHGILRAILELVMKLAKKSNYPQLQ